MEQRTETLPIACVEGWTTTQDWTGVPLASLAEVVGAAGAGEVLVESLQARGTFRQVTLTRTQFGNERALLALKVNGADLSLDHGFPARVIVPGAARRAQHEVGGGDDLQGRGMSASATATARRRSTRSRTSPRSRSPASRCSSSSTCAPPATCSLWFVAAVVLHDFVLLPFYSGARPGGAARQRRGGVNYLRVPAGLSGLLLLVFFPLILGRSTAKLEQVSGAPAAGLPRPLAAHHRRAVRRLRGAVRREVAQGRREAPARRRGGNRTGRPRTCRRRAGAAGNASRARARVRRARCAAPVWGSLIGTPSNTRGSARASPIVQ